jgi:hypothetical protein
VEDAAVVSPTGRSRKRWGWLILAASGALVAGAGLYVLLGPGSGISIFGGLHRRADRLQSDPPAGLTLVRRYDEGNTFCPFECGGAYTTMVYAGPGLDREQLCGVAEAKLTELFGQPTTGRAQPSGCVKGNAGETWPLPGVYQDHASASLRVEQADQHNVAGGGLVLVALLDSGRY